jgi:anthranilate phosphoribosyltransferase
MIRDVLEQFFKGQDLSHDQMVEAMSMIMGGSVPPELIAGFLVGLQVKGYTVTEMTAAAGVMRELSSKVEAADRENLVDTCGTGGDGTRTFNISTAASFVVAAAGGRVAKHGGRSVSSSSGSADVLEALGARIDLDPDQVSDCLNEVGVGFMFAPAHHAAMKHAAPVRKALGIKTLLNVLGPLTNPAGAKRQVMGVYDPALLVKQAQVLQNLGSSRAMIVCGDDGLDEISPAGVTHVAELHEGRISEYTICVDDFGLTRVDLLSLCVDGVEQAVKMLRDSLSGEFEQGKTAVSLNAGAALYVLGLRESLRESVGLATTVIESGAALEKLDEFVAYSNAIRG